MRKIVLASQSPRRRELMMQAGYEFDVTPSTVEERITKEQPWEVVEELSLQKAQDVYGKVDTRDENAEALVIGADTVVSVDGKILGKPKTKEEAYQMLSLLQGRTHQVYTGVTLVWNDEENKRALPQEHTFHACTEVTFYPMSEEEINSYIATGDCMDKAGAYGIQGKCAIYIEKINGDYNNVVGLPIGRLYQEIIKVVK